MYPAKLSGKLCYLTPVDESLADVVARWSNDLEIGIRTGDATDMINISKQREYLVSMKEGQNFMIISSENHEAIGIIRLKNCDFIQGVSELGLFIGNKSYWNKGYAREAIQLILDYGFSILNMKNIMLHVFEFNSHALELYKKLGFKEIGRRRKSIEIGSVRYDDVFMDILSSEFNSELVKLIL